MAKKKTSKKKSNNKKTLITALVVILVIAIIAALIFISVKGLWGDIIDFVKDLIAPQPDEDIDSGDTPNSGDNPNSGEISSGDVSNPINGIAQMKGEVLEMRVLDIGQGDCILLLFPDGQVMVMDIGSEFGTPSPWSVIDGALKELEITTIDYFFLTHTDYDHARETKKLADNYQIKNFYLPRADIDTSNTWKNSYNAAHNETYEEDGETKNAAVKENVGSYEIRGENWLMKCYSFDESDYPNIKNSSSAENKNAVSPICLLEYAGRTIVLTGDANEKTENYLLNKGYFDNVDADVLKVGHHGSKSSTTNEFLNKVDCEYAIISCGADNDYGHPTPEALKRLEDYRDLVLDGDYDGFASVYRTDEDGTITVQIDEEGTINLIADENGDKNTTTGTPIEQPSGDASSGVVAMIYRDYKLQGIITVFETAA